mgnify:CR=1 FL=1
MAQTQKHIPVMLDEVLQALNPQDGKTYVDATFGNGGYTSAILNAADCKVIALDRDPTVVKRADELKKIYGDRFEFVAGRFGDFAKLVTQDIDGAVFEIGVSSMQIDTADRGFSFAKDGALDMRMSLDGKSAKDIVNTYGEKELADILYNYGEEKKSYQIARKIVQYREEKEISSTTELAEIIYSVIHKKFGEIDPATRTFQALRIAVNNELEELQNGLEGAVLRLKSGAPIIVVSFHSLEERIVKNYFKEKSGKTAGTSRYMPEVQKTAQQIYFTKYSKAIAPSAEEIARNPRSRSAKMRFALKS